MPSNNMFIASPTRNSPRICEVLYRPPIRKQNCCIRIPTEVIRDPDPAIYDEQLVYTSGNHPTFNSPDLETVSLWPIAPIDSLTATVRNLSSDASAHRTRVDISWSAWGIGMARQPLGSSFIDLDRAGFVGSQGTLSWTTPAALKDASRYGIFVRVIHPFDRDSMNNESEQTVDGFQTSEGRSKTFIVPVRNPTGAVQTISLSAGPATILPWVTITPSTFTLNPGTEENVMVHVNVPTAIPASPSGTLISATIDVLALMSGTYLGGVSILVLLNG